MPDILVRLAASASSKRSDASAPAPGGLAHDGVVVGRRSGDDAAAGTIIGGVGSWMERQGPLTSDGLEELCVHAAARCTLLLLPPCAAAACVRTGACPRTITPGS
jgi:hypothetical protein